MQVLGQAASWRFPPMLRYRIFAYNFSVSVPVADLLIASAEPNEQTTCRWPEELGHLGQFQFQN